MLCKFMFLKSFFAMTKLGEFLARKSINRASISRKTGISKTRLSELSNNNSTKLRAEELHLIALAVDVDPSDLLKHVCGHLKLKKD
jgi:DNA-binding Xre family transcriptional regulator